jgi:hypothetical protein
VRRLPAAIHDCANERPYPRNDTPDVLGLNQLHGQLLEEPRSTRRHGPFVVNFWGSWCPGCRIKTRELVAPSTPTPLTFKGLALNAVPPTFATNHRPRSGSSSATSSTMSGRPAAGVRPRPVLPSDRPAPDAKSSPVFPRSLRQPKRASPSC